MTATQHSRSGELSLAEAAQQLIEECRMVLPGIQALFGFQLIAAFSPGFAEKLPAGLQRLHLGATVLNSVAIALIMTPAAYRRQASPRHVSDDFLRITTRLLAISMFPLAASLCIELYLVAYAIVGTTWVSAALAAALFALFMSLWLAMPRAARRKTRGKPY